ncbi:MAG TPA: hypothetical protein VKW04_15925 [Planctomycetota bacterium]|nr:hypothetical protein [Planctomycetota bacterium]
MTPLPAAVLFLVPILMQPKPAAPPPELAATFEFSPSPDFAGAWQTTVVELDSRTRRSLDLTIRIEDDSYLAIATRQEALAPGARKRVFLYTPAASFQRGIPARYRITDERGTELVAGQLPASSRGYAANGFQIGLFCRVPAAEDDFAIPTSLNSLEVRCGRLSPRTFPDRWVGLASLDLIVIHDAPLDELTTDQGRALLDYVRQGGSILVIPGSTSGWLSHPVLRSVAPVRADSARTVSSLPGFAAEFGAVRGADSFLVQPLLNGIPLLGGSPDSGHTLVRFDTGLGRAFVVGADLRRAPFDTWTGRRMFWTYLLNRIPRWFQEDLLPFPVAASPAQRDDLFQRMSRLINPYPPFGLILGLAVVFLGIVGPLNYGVLWKLRRTLLLVVTVPGISIGFLALIVVLGYLLKGTSTVAHSARLLSTRSGLGLAREIHLFTLFSPATRTYDVLFEPGTYGPFDRWNEYDRQNYRRRLEAMTPLTMQTGSPMAIRGLHAGQWQSWDIETRAIRDLGNGIRFSVEGRRLKIHNGSARVIERGVFVQTGREGASLPFSGLGAGGDFEAPLSGAQRLGFDALGLAPGSLGETLLRPWLDSVSGEPAGASANGQTQRFLLCILRDEGAPVTVDARLSSRSRSVTVLHVAEAP